MDSKTCSDISIFLETTIDNTPVKKHLKCLDEVDSKELSLIISTFLENNFSPQNDDRVSSSYSLERRHLFDSLYIKKPSKLELEKYIERIIAFSEIEKGTLIYAIALISEMLKKNTNSIRLCAQNINLLLLASVICSVKLLEDKIFLNSFYAKIGGISLEKVNLIEASFFEIINYELVIKDEVYYAHHDFLIDFSLNSL